jgi:hypothetical protein
LVCINVASQQNTEIIYWNNLVKPAWKDFKFISTDSLIIQKNYNGEKALSKLRIVFCELDPKNGIPQFSVFNFFRKDSYTTDTLSISLLHHEILHFDINELFARKIRKEIVTYQQNNVVDVNEYFNIINANQVLKS